MSKRQEVAEVLIAAHLPGCMFEGRITSGGIDFGPVNDLILDIKRCLWSVEFGGTRKQYDKEYEQFLILCDYPCQLRNQAIVLGLDPDNNRKKVKSIKQHIQDTLIEDGVDRMPSWLFYFCYDAIWGINLKGHGDIW